MDPVVAAATREMTGFFFGGGDQTRIVNSFYNAGRTQSDVLLALRQTYEAGAVVSGTSAGAACMPSAVMVTGGSSYEVSPTLQNDCTCTMSYLKSDCFSSRCCTARSLLATRKDPTT